jgi:hypothetical protein
MSALATLVGAKIGLIVVGDAFETHKAHRLGAKFTCRTDQSGKVFGRKAGFQGMFHAIK